VPDEALNVWAECFGRLKESDAILVGDEGEVVFFHSYFSSPDSSPLRFLSSLICSS